MSVEQESAIRQLLARSSDCVWRKDIEQYGQCWSNTGEWRVLGLSFHGRDAIKAGWWQFMDALKTAWQVSNNVALAIDGEVAYGRIYLDETLLMPDGSVTLTRGVYHDIYRIEEGCWVFSRRQIDFCYMGPPDMSGRFFALPDYGPGPRDNTPDRPAMPSMQQAYG